MKTSFRKVGRIAAVAAMSAAVAFAADAATRTWDGSKSSGTWSDGSNWGGTAPTASDDVVFPANGDFTVNFSAAAKGKTFTIGAGTSLKLGQTSGTGAMEHYFQGASGDFTFLGDGASFCIDKYSTRSSNYIRLNDDKRTSGATASVGSNTKIEAMNGAKLKAYGLDYGSSSNVFIHVNSGDLSLYTRNDVEMTSANVGFRFVAEGASGSLQLTAGGSDGPKAVKFNAPGLRYSFVARDGAKIGATMVDLLAGVGTVSVSGTGSEIYLNTVCLSEAGAVLSVADTSKLKIYDGGFTLGGSAVLEFSGSDPQVYVQKNDVPLSLNSGATLRFVPAATWSETVGRIEVNPEALGNVVTVASGVKYEIDTSNLEYQKKFCILSCDNTQYGKTQRSYSLPDAGNVRLVGSNAAQFTATVTKDNLRIYCTVTPREKEVIEGGTEMDITVAGVDYHVISFTDTEAAHPWTVPQGVSAIDLLMVGGGGAGGFAKNTSTRLFGGGGGGGGGVIYKERLAVVPGSVFTFKVGKGGTGTTTSALCGEASTVENAASSVSLVADGGGNGAGVNGNVAIAAGNGGSGGGGLSSDDANAVNALGGLPTGNGMGTPGGSCHMRVDDGKYRHGGGSGGGAASAGMTPKSLKGQKAGIGFHCNITGSVVCYGGGGGGPTIAGYDQESSTPIAGGGGIGADDGQEGGNGIDGLGGGGGGGSGSGTVNAFRGGHGGSGVIIVRYATDTGTVKVPTGLSPNGVEVALHNALQKEFLAMSSAERRAAFVNSSWRGTISKEAGDCLPKPVTFGWESGGLNTLTVYNADGSVFLQREVLGNSTEVVNLVPGTNYTWTVANASGTSAVAAFTTEDEFPRMLQDPGFDLRSNCTRKLVGIVNARDLGGLVGLEGRRVKFGRVFRTGRFNETACYSRLAYDEPGETYVRTAASSNFWRQTIGLKTHVDLRNIDEWGSNAVNRTVGPLGEGIEYVHLCGDPSRPDQSCPLYTNIYTDWGRKQAKRFLDVLLDPSKYPLAFHCSAGKDRTGTLAYILEAILGVDDDAKELDWCLLVLSTTDTQFNFTDYFDPFVAGFNDYPGETVNERVVAYVKSIGVTDEQITAFRSAMLEGYEPPVEPPPVVPPPEHPYTATWTGNGTDLNWDTEANWNWMPTKVDSVLFDKDSSFVANVSGYGKDNPMVPLTTVADGVTVAFDPDSASNGHTFYTERLRIGEGGTFRVVGHAARAKNCHEALAAGATLYVGSGMKFYSKTFDQAGAGAKIVLDNATCYFYYEDNRFEFGDKAATLVFSGAEPLLSTESYDGAIVLGDELTVKLVPEEGWSATEGRIIGKSDSNVISVSAKVHYEIDISKLDMGTIPKTFCLVSLADDNDKEQNLNAPAAANVKLVGAGAENYACTFVADNVRKTMTFTIGEKPPAKEVVPGTPQELSAMTREMAEAEAADCIVVIADSAAAAAGQASVVKIEVEEKDGEFYAVVAIDKTKITSLDETLAEIGASISEVAAAAAAEQVELTLPPAKVTSGLYYSIVSDTAVDGEYATEGDRVLATGSSVTLKVARPDGPMGFFRAKASLTDK